MIYNPKRPKARLRLARLVLWVVLALCAGRNPESVKLLVPQLPSCLQPVCSLEAEPRPRVLMFSQVPAR